MRRFYFLLCPAMLAMVLVPVAGCSARLGPLTWISRPISTSKGTSRADCGSRLMDG